MRGTANHRIHVSGDTVKIVAYSAVRNVTGRLSGFLGLTCQLELNYLFDVLLWVFAGAWCRG